MGAVRMRGRGEIVEPLDVELPNFCGILVYPDSGVSTAQAFALLDAMDKRETGTSTERFISRLRNHNKTKADATELLTTNLSNDFEAVVLSAYPEIAKAYEMIVSAGALRALLCGSGSTIFGLARDLEHAKMLLDRLSAHYSFVKIVSSFATDLVDLQQL